MIGPSWTHDFWGVGWAWGSQAVTWEGRAVSSEREGPAARAEESTAESSFLICMMPFLFRSLYLSNRENYGGNDSHFTAAAKVPSRPGVGAEITMW